MTHDNTLPKLYQQELAPWWPLMSSPSEYKEEAAEALTLLTEACKACPQTLLELGSGGGNNASHLKANIPNMTLVDLSAGMLAVSTKLNPACEHIQGDMRDVRLARLFDAVLIHDAIMYMTNEADLKAAIETAWVHCKPSGAVLLEPDCTRELFETTSSHGGHDDAQGRGFRYLEWSWDPDPSDTTYIADYAYLIRDTDGSVRTVHDRHTIGLFSRDVWLRLMHEVGFETRTTIDTYDRELFIGIKPA